MKILIEESVLRQALEHIEYVANIGTSMSRDTCHYLMDESRKEAEALRTALDAAEGVEPEQVRCRYCGQDTMHMGDVCYSCNNPAPTVPEGYTWEQVS